MKSIIQKQDSLLFKVANKRRTEKCFKRDNNDVEAIWRKNYSSRPKLTLGEQ
jgi:hypothetical protein